MGKEQEQQASLALEDVELQKTALRTEADNRVKEIQLELEAARTVSVLLFFWKEMDPLIWADSVL